MYSWHDVAHRIGCVYKDASQLRSRLSFGERLRLADFGPVTGFVAILVHVVQFLLFVLVAVFRPVCIIERAPDFPLRAFNTKSGRIHPCAAERAARG